MYIYLTSFECSIYVYATCKRKPWENLEKSGPKNTFSKRQINVQLLTLLWDRLGSPKAVVRRKNVQWTLLKQILNAYLTFTVNISCTKRADILHVKKTFSERLRQTSTGSRVNVQKTFFLRYALVGI